MVPVTVQTYLVGRVEDDGFALLKVPRCENPPRIACYVREIPGRREVAQSRDASPARAHLNAVHD